MADEPNSKEQEDEYRTFLAKGELRMQCCTGCKTYRYPARFICPQCLSEEWSWRPISGRGTVDTFLWYFQPVDPRCLEVPYNVALLKLDEGPRVYGNVLDVKFGELAVGNKVKAKITSRDGRQMLNFTPAS